MKLFIECFKYLHEIREKSKNLFFQFYKIFQWHPGFQYRIWTTVTAPGMIGWGGKPRRAAPRIEGAQHPSRSRVAASPSSWGSGGRCKPPSGVQGRSPWKLSLFHDFTTLKCPFINPISDAKICIF